MIVTIESAGDTITLQPVDQSIVIRRAIAGSDGQQFVWRIDVVTAQIIADHLNDLLDDVIEEE